jgi:hypothetical protein
MIQIRLEPPDIVNAFKKVSRTAKTLMKSFICYPTCSFRNEDILIAYTVLAAASGEGEGNTLAA